MKDLPPAIERALVALSCDDAEFTALFAEDVGDDGQLRRYTRSQYMALLLVTLSDLAHLATMPTETRH